MVLGLGGGGGGGAGLLGGIGGTIGSIAILAGAAGDGGEDTIKKMVKLWEKLETPEYDMRDLDPEELKMVAEFFPNIYEAAVPNEAKTAADSPEIRDAQTRGLAHLERVASEGLPLGERLSAQRQGRELSRESSRIQKGIGRGFQERGRGGGGMELQGRMAGSQQASEVAGELGANLATEAERNRVQGAQAMMDAATGVRGQDIALRQSNAGAINRFNEFVSNAMNQSRAYGAGASERAQAYNVGTRQGLDDQNVGTRNYFAQRNQDNRNRLLGQGYQDEISRLTGLSNALGQQAQGEYAEQAMRAQALRGIGSGGGQAAGAQVDRSRRTGSIFG